MLILAPLQKAYAKTKIAHERWSLTTQDEELRDAVIQRFEYTLELTWKTLRRALREIVIDSAEVEELTKRQIFRLAAEKGFISNPENWFEYVEARNLTSHTYNEETAVQVANLMGRFIADMSEVLSKLETKYGSDSISS